MPEKPEYRSLTSATPAHPVVEVENARFTGERDFRCVFCLGRNGAHDPHCLALKGVPFAPPPTVGSREAEADRHARNRALALAAPALREALIQLARAEMWVPIARRAEFVELLSAAEREAGALAERVGGAS